MGPDHGFRILMGQDLLLHGNGLIDGDRPQLRVGFPHIQFEKNRHVFIHVPNEIRIEVVDLKLPDADDILIRPVFEVSTAGFEPVNETFFRHALEFFRGFLNTHAGPFGHRGGFLEKKGKKERQFRLLFRKQAAQDAQFHSAVRRRKPPREVIQVFRQPPENVFFCHPFLFSLKAVFSLDETHKRIKKSPDCLTVVIVGETGPAEPGAFKVAVNGR